MASRSELILCAALFLFACPSRALAEKLQITSNPAGATVEINGVALGTTPFEKDYPGGFFHKTRTSFGARLEHRMVARISLAGYATKELTLTEGPMIWVSLYGRVRGEYWLLKSNHFKVDLQPVSDTFTGEVSATVSSGSIELKPQLSREDLIAWTKPAVVCLRGRDKSGSGFFVTGTGVIATNAHVARGEETLLAILPGGQQLEAKVVYIDDDLDIALAKVNASGASSEFPPTSAEFTWAKVSSPSAIRVRACSSASPRGLLARSENLPRTDPAPGSRPMPSSIPAIVAARWSTRGARSSVSTA